MSRVEPYYSDSRVRIYHGAAADVLDGLTGEVPIDHMITDPPYGEQTHAGARTKSKDRKLVNFASTTSADIAHIVDLCRPARWVVMTCDIVHAVELQKAPPFGYRYIRHGCWVKPDSAPQFTGDRPAQGWEAVAVLHSTFEPPSWNGGGRRAVWRYNCARGRHPTQKPLELLLSFVELFTNKGDTIIDPYCGSGTTLQAAKMLGRNAIGIDQDEACCKAAVKACRQEMLTGVI